VSVSRTVRVAGSGDLPFLIARDHHGVGLELAEIVARGRVLIADDESHASPVGWLRWGLFWDQVPFMNLLYVVDAHRGHGVGRLLVEEWEHRCAAAGHPMVLTSTMSDEDAQHFYRHLGYLDAGALQLPDEAPELLFRKPLGAASSEMSQGREMPI
jgi:GNAT superfamily N-acetyltransferase